MPEFGNPFAGLKNGRKLTHEELVRAIRFMVSAEYEAIQLYEQLAESTDNKLAQEVLRDIADEEKVHAGEFLRLLHELQPDEEKFYGNGAKEVEEEIAKSKPAAKIAAVKTAATTAAKSAVKTSKKQLQNPPQNRLQNLPQKPRRRRPPQKLRQKNPLQKSPQQRFR
jgi:Uncharacterized conserved protein